MDMTNQPLQKPAGREASPLVPAVDIIEDAEGIVLAADLPGVAKEDVALCVEADTLTLEGVVKLGEAPTMQPVYAEVGVARYRRSFVLGRDLDTSRIEAEMKNGVLRVRVPKQERAKPRRIDVRGE
jgi:HSP20 family molecular chaperone IbpA